MLSGEQIKRKALIQQDRPDGYRAASYDLAVGSIIPPLSRAMTSTEAIPAVKSVDGVIIPPQGMVEVISQERVQLPDNIAGYATVKTGLCEKGILAINIGIIDPLYNGLISSTLINFGKSEFNLKQGEAFLRLTFFEYTPSEKVAKPALKTDQAYMNDKEAKVLQHLSRTFLNLDQTIKDLTAPILNEWTSGMLRYVVIGTLLVGTFAFLVTLGTSYATRSLVPGDTNKAETRALIQQVRDSTNAQLQRLRDDVARLQRLQSQDGRLTTPGSGQRTPTDSGQ
jgi:deoxycytidine triphosphate deaminase